jgi:hypothetical protein
VFPSPFTSADPGKLLCVSKSPFPYSAKAPKVTVAEPKILANESPATML